MYRCSNGRFYGDVDLWERFESGEWSPCCWDEESGTEWVYATTDDLLTLTPVPPSEIPTGVTVTATEGGVRVESTPTPAGRPPTRR